MFCCSLFIAGRTLCHALVGTGQCYFLLLFVFCCSRMYDERTCALANVLDSVVFVCCSCWCCIVCGRCWLCECDCVCVCVWSAVCVSVWFTTVIHVMSCDNRRRQRPLESTVGATSFPFLLLFLFLPSFSFFSVPFNFSFCLPFPPFAFYPFPFYVLFQLLNPWERSICVDNCDQTKWLLQTWCRCRDARYHPLRFWPWWRGAIRAMYSEPVWQRTCWGLSACNSCQRGSVVVVCISRWDVSGRVTYRCMYACSRVCLKSHL